MAIMPLEKSLFLGCTTHTYKLNTVNVSILKILMEIVSVRIGFRFLSRNLVHVELRSSFVASNDVYG
jgi:hypothetical protein